MGSNSTNSKKTAGADDIKFSGFEPPQLVIDDTSVQSDMNFFRIMTENMKINFNSPLRSNTQFPTPYSSNQLAEGNKLNSKAWKNGNTGRSENDSSLLENSMLPDGNMSMSNVLPIQANNGELLNDMNCQPSTAMALGASFPNEFLLASPENFRDFLLESPAGFNLFNKTPAKTPLKFFTDTNSGKSSNFQNPNNLFGANSSSAIKNKNGLTPLRNLELNMMFDSNQMSMAFSPSKQLSASITPYKRKPLNEIGTPYAKNLMSTNSALVDFQKARKSVSHLNKTPETTTKYRNFSQVEWETPRDDNLKLKHSSMTKLTLPNVHDNDRSLDDIYGSSPTTIQINSSVTKSPNKTIDSIDNSKIDDRLFESELDKMPISPTPKSFKENLGTLSIPDLPKMGSFSSDRQFSIKSNSNKNPRNSKIKKKTKKQPKFQIIVSNAHKFNTSKTFEPSYTGKTIKKNKPKLKRTRSLVVGPTNSNDQNKLQENDKRRNSQSFPTDNI